MIMIEKDLKIYDIWESPNGNVFIKISDEYSIAIGGFGNHAPNEEWGELKKTQYVKSNDITPVKKIGRMVFASKNYRVITPDGNVISVEEYMETGDYFSKLEQQVEDFMTNGKQKELNGLFSGNNTDVWDEDVMDKLIDEYEAQYHSIEDYTWDEIYELKKTLWVGYSYHR
jgi:hypothetical protein